MSEKTTVKDAVQTEKTEAKTKKTGLEILSLNIGAGQVVYKYHDVENGEIKVMLNGKETTFEVKDGIFAFPFDKTYSIELVK